jgi:hypothetical protein
MADPARLLHAPTAHARAKTSQQVPKSAAPRAWQADVRSQKWQPRRAPSLVALGLVPFELRAPTRLRSPREQSVQSRRQAPRRAHAGTWNPHLRAAACCRPKRRHAWMCQRRRTDTYCASARSVQPRRPTAASVTASARRPTSKPPRAVRNLRRPVRHVVQPAAHVQRSVRPRQCVRGSPAAIA